MSNKEELLDWMTHMSEAIQAVKNLCENVPGGHRCDSCPVKLDCAFAFSKNCDSTKMVNSIEAFQKDLQNSISAYKQELIAEGEFECETKDCAYNHEGMCRFQRVHDRKPTITEDDGCVDGVSAIEIFR